MFVYLLLLISLKEYHCVFFVTEKEACSSRGNNVNEVNPEDNSNNVLKSTKSGRCVSPKPHGGIKVVRTAQRASLVFTTSTLYSEHEGFNDGLTSARSEYPKTTSDAASQTEPTKRKNRSLKLFPLLPKIKE